MFPYSAQNAPWKQNTEDHFSKYTLVKQCYLFWQSAVFCLFSACVKQLKIRATDSSISKGLLQTEKWLWRQAAMYA